MDFFKVLEVGGVIIIPLLLLSVITLTLIIDLTIFNLKLHKNFNKFTQKSEIKENDPIVKIASTTNLSVEDKLAGITFALQKIERKTSYLSIIASVSPLVGLLGTVMGMIKIFNVVSIQKPTNPLEALSGGISEALFTTAGGLFVAIIAGFAHHFLTSSLDSLEDKTLIFFNKTQKKSV